MTTVYPPGWRLEWQREKPKTAGYYWAYDSQRRDGPVMLERDENGDWFAFGSDEMGKELWFDYFLGPLMIPIPDTPEAGAP